MKFVLDTNFLLIPAKFKVDVFTELEKFGKPKLFTSDLVLRELDTVVKRGTSDARNAMIGMVLIEKKCINVIPAELKEADEEMLRLAELGYIVCTQDTALIRRLKKDKRPVITLRQKKYLVKL